MKAKLTNLLTGKEIIVHESTSNPACSYGKPVWADEEGNAYGQVGMPMPFYKIEVEKN